MNNIDSVKLVLSSDLIRYNALKFDKTTKEVEDVELTSYNLKAKERKTGIKNIIVNENNCIIDLSSKLCPHLYYEMINENTIERYAEKLNGLDLIQFDKNSFIENANVLSCDITDNIKIKGEVKNYVDSFAVFKLNNKYNCSYHINESIIFERDVKTPALKERITIYNKYPELLLKRNATFRNEINIQDFKDVLRFESRFVNFGLMRNSFNVSDLNLLNILKSPAKINLNLINKITDISSISIESFNNFNTLIEMKKKYKYSKLRNIQGDISILNTCNNDMDLIRLFFKTNSTANNSKSIRHLKELSKSLKEIESKNTITEKVNEMKRLLLVA
jgi:hypothetical protein